MSIQERFTSAVNNEAGLDPEKREQHSQNANVNSHQGFFAGKRPKRPSGATENPDEGYRVANSPQESALLLSTDVKGARQNIRRGELLKDYVMEALTKRVQDPTGWQVMNLSMKDWIRMHEEYVDAEKVGKQGTLPFQPYSTYAQNILFKTDGTPRTKPIRGFLPGEVGQFISGPHEGKIICVKEKSPDDDGRRYIQVPETTSFIDRLNALTPKDPIDDVLENVSK